MILVWVGSIFVGLMVLSAKRPQAREHLQAKRWSAMILVVAGMMGYATSPQSYLLALQIFGCVLLGYVVTYVSGVLLRPRYRSY